MYAICRRLCSYIFEAGRRRDGMGPALRPGLPPACEAPQLRPEQQQAMLQLRQAYLHNLAVVKRRRKEASATLEVGCASLFVAELLMLPPVACLFKVPITWSFKKFARGGWGTQSNICFYMPAAGHHGGYRLLRDRCSLATGGSRHRKAEADVRICQFHAAVPGTLGLFCSFMNSICTLSISSGAYP